MTGKKIVRLAALGLFLVGAAAAARAQDWPHWGRDGSRNMVAPAATNLPESAEPGKARGDSKEIDPATTQNVKWAAKLGDQSYGNPTVAGGRVFVGTNNGSPRDPSFTADAGVLMAFDEKTGKFLWQLLAPKLGAGNVSDWEGVGLCSSPAVEGDRVYVVTNRCEVLCLDVNGLADGNAGPFTDEAAYLHGRGTPDSSAAALGPGHCDIVWRFDMRDELGVFPHHMTSSSVLIVGDRLYATTSNSVEWTGRHTPNPDAPALVCLDKRTGKLLARERSGISRRLFNSNWSSPAYGVFGGRPLVVFGGGDGFCYAFDPEPAEATGDDDRVGTLREVWRCDCNPPGRRVGKDGKPISYKKPAGPSEIVATPVVVGGRVYVAIGQGPDNGVGAGALTCIDGTQAGDITATGIVWQFDKIKRSLSTASVADGLVYMADYSGNLHCLDATTGRLYWTFDTEGAIWGSTLVADGKIYLGNESGLLTVLPHGKEKPEDPLGEIDFAAPVYSTPVAANGVLYVTTDKYLYALQDGSPPAAK